MSLESPGLQSPNPLSSSESICPSFKSRSSIVQQAPQANPTFLVSRSWHRLSVASQSSPPVAAECWQLKTVVAALRSGCATDPPDTSICLPTSVNMASRKLVWLTFLACPSVICTPGWKDCDASSLSTSLCRLLLLLHLLLVPSETWASLSSQDYPTFSWSGSALLSTPPLSPSSVSSPPPNHCKC